jgi:predicted DNA-binding protein with PD1-like motif
MHVNELGREGRGHTFALIFDPGDEFMETLRSHARRSGVKAAHFTALGAFRSATLAYFDWDTKEYREIPVDEQVEVTSLVGDVGVHDGETVIHAHCVLGRSDGSAITGHLLEGHVRPTLELFLTAYDNSLVRRVDEESGLPLIR